METKNNSKSFYIICKDKLVIKKLTAALADLEHTDITFLSDTNELKTQKPSKKFICIFIDCRTTQNIPKFIENINKKIKASVILMTEKNNINDLKLENKLSAHDYITLPVLPREVELVLSSLHYKYSLTKNSFESNTLFNTLVNELPDIVYTIDDDGNFTFISEKIRNYGYNPNKLIGKHYSTIIHPEDYSRISRKNVLPLFKGRVTGDINAPKLFDERRTDERATENLQLRIKPHNITPAVKANAAKDDFIKAKVSASGIFDGKDDDIDKKYIGTVGVISNIAASQTEGKQNPDIKSAASDVPEIIYKIDDEGKFIYLSKEIKHLGYNPGDLIGKHFSVLFDFDSNNKPKKTNQNNNQSDFVDFSEVKKASGLEGATEIKIQSKDQNDLKTGTLSSFDDFTEWTEVTSQGIYQANQKSEEKKFMGTIGIIRNIAARKKAEQIQKQMHQELEENLKEMETNISKAQKLQMKLNTIDLPLVPEFNIKSLYLPSKKLSGDFFDIKTFQNKLYIIVGDCTGHGIEAAMDATLLKSISDRHTWLLQKLNAPDIYLEHMNLDLLKYLEEDKYPTMFVCVIDLKTKQMTYANAASEFPYIVNKNEIKRLKSVQGFFLGYKKDTIYTKNIIQLDPGDVLFFYSDALLEIHKNNNKPNHEGVEDILTIVGNGLNNDVDNILKKIKEINNDKLPLPDDLTMIMLEYCLPVERQFTLRTKNKIKMIEERLNNDLNYFSYSENDIAKIEISMQEMIENAFTHGNKEDPQKKVQVSYILNCEKIVIDIIDEGSGFDVKSIPDPTDETRLNKLLKVNKIQEYTHGRGVWITRYYMDSIDYNLNGNKVTIAKNKSQQQSVFMFNEKNPYETKSQMSTKNIFTWDEDIKINSIIHNSNKKIKVKFKKNYYIRSKDILKIINMINLLKNSNKQVELHIANDELKNVIQELKLNDNACIKLL